MASTGDQNIEILTEPFISHHLTDTYSLWQGLELLRFFALISIYTATLVGLYYIQLDCLPVRSWDIVGASS